MEPERSNYLLINNNSICALREKLFFRKFICRSFQTQIALEVIVLHDPKFDLCEGVDFKYRLMLNNMVKNLNFKFSQSTKLMMEPHPPSHAVLSNDASTTTTLTTRMPAFLV